MSVFWQEHQVGGPYETTAESYVALFERAHLYPDLYRLMPVDLPDETVLDFGCGPGHDTVLFLLGGAKHVYYTDISELALQITADRLGLHQFVHRATEWDLDRELPPVDHVHCAGVLHHTENPVDILVRLNHALKPGGEARIMVYDGTLSEHTQSQVPITEWWTCNEFLSLATEAGFDGEYVGSYPCSAPWRPNCFAACYLLT